MYLVRRDRPPPDGEVNDGDGRSNTGAGDVKGTDAIVWPGAFGVDGPFVMVVMAGAP